MASGRTSEVNWIARSLKRMVLAQQTVGTPVQMPGARPSVKPSEPQRFTHRILSVQQMECPVLEGGRRAAWSISRFEARPRPPEARLDTWQSREAPLRAAVGDVNLAVR